jgi:hypothetical protein
MSTAHAARWRQLSPRQKGLLALTVDSSRDGTVLTGHLSTGQARQSLEALERARLVTRAYPSDPYVITELGRMTVLARFDEGAKR